jgi:hypothetical protein
MFQVLSSSGSWFDFSLLFAEVWGTKMNLGGESYSTAQLSATKEAMEAFLRDPTQLAQAEAFSAGGKASERQGTILACFVRTFKCYQMADPDAVALRAKCTAVEDSLNDARNKTFSLGLNNPATKGFEEKSSVQLRTIMRTSPDEATRKAAWEGLRSIGPFVLDSGLCEMVKLRNAMARKLGFEDFYDYKVTQAEGFGKAALFEILDTLKSGSDALLAQARAKLSEEKGTSALEAWNMGFMMAGDVEAALDPYFPFEKRLVWHVVGLVWFGLVWLFEHVVGLGWIGWFGELGVFRLKGLPTFPVNTPFSYQNGTFYFFSFRVFSHIAWRRGAAASVPWASSTKGRP